ncbi:alpha/beta hydrolase-fold protein [Aurantiacibacter sp. MUD11]|uniref:alpha/beta hydrolase n=1 Tax=Aurantiacibacter sp. MUD11 TaxID=3003265 RepID=UPI0022AAFB21|nr:alpha/beta hydrolase-fold protein [Aurantiacibacter sp. MUD11]WAT16938.1 alpha/beta hydrolase-fold protein [Aurantiacibacter sp. MUD11]
MLKTVTAAFGVAAAALLVAAPVAAQESARVTETTFEAPSLAGNLEGNSTARSVVVVTPPGYDENPDKRYPVVYYLHGYWMPVDVQQAGFRLDEAVQAASEAGHDFIMVMPDGFSKLRGGFYSSGPTVGDYESMVANDLVNWVDANYRTIADPASRGLAGHSMGGYGTIRIAMHRPGIFSSIYMMSACCLEPMTLSAEDAARIDGMSPEDVAAADFGGLAQVSTLAAWSPDPRDEGFLKADSGLREDGSLDPLVNYRLAANSPIVLLPQYLPELHALEGFAMDIGDQDFLLEPNRQWREQLDHFGIEYDFELYEGDHGNRIRERIRTHVLPFFAEHLDAQ